MQCTGVAPAPRLLLQSVERWPPFSVAEKGQPSHISAVMKRSDNCPRLFQKLLRATQMRLNGDGLWRCQHRHIGCYRFQQSDLSMLRRPLVP